MAPEQYDQNVKTKSGSDAHVEFAKASWKRRFGKEVYLPIDAKFLKKTSFDFKELMTLEILWL